MTGTDIQEKSIKAMIAMNAAIRNIRLYPITSAATINSIDKAYEIIKDALIHTKNLVFAESEKRLIVCSHSLSEADQQKPQVASFLDLLLNFEIKNLTIKQNLQKSELTNFLKIISTSYEKIKNSSSINKLFLDNNISQIKIEHKVYISLEDDQKIASEQDQEVNIGEVLGPMVNTLDHILDSENKTKVSRSLAASIASKDEEVLTKVLTQKMQGEMGIQLFDHLIDEIDDEKFERLVFKIKQMAEKISKENKNGVSEATDTIINAFRNMIKSEKGEQLQIRIKERKVRELKEKRKKSARLKAGLNSILSEKNQAFKNPEIMEFLPGAIQQLIINKQNKAAEKFIDRLGDGLLSKDSAIRTYVAHALVQVIYKVESEKQLNIVKRLSYNITDWLKFEFDSNEDYKKLCVYLTFLAKTMLTKRQFVQCNYILEAFHFVSHQKKCQKCRSIAQKMLQKIAEDEILNLILSEFQSKNTDSRKQAAYILICLGSSTIPLLLTILKTSENRYERARILKLLTQMGQSVIPYLKEEIKSGKPWYYIRNLVLLFGKLGNSSHLEILVPFLKYKDIRVRRECLNSICYIGAEKCGDIFINAMPSAGDRFKIDIVKMLGQIKCKNAVPMFIEMLESKTIISLKTREKLQKSICISLGCIGSPEAIPVLQTISEQKKSLLKSGSVQAAALKALAMLNQN